MTLARKMCVLHLQPLIAAAAIVWQAMAVAQPSPLRISQPADLAAVYAREVDRRLTLPEPEQAFYASLLARALQVAGVRIEQAQLIVLVDRSAWVQAVLLWWAAPDATAQIIGASPASTGRPSGFEHFETPTGVFEHSLANPDFRAEGTLNEFGIRGYGDKGMRVYDFGWVMGRRGWMPGEQLMRLQLHATDRSKLEPRLGQRESKGCIRIPATLNTFIDGYGVLDAAYEEAMAAGREFWVLRPDRTPTPWSGRYLVIIDSQRTDRPAWSPAPGAVRPVTGTATGGHAGTATAHHAGTATTGHTGTATAPKAFTCW